MADADWARYKQIRGKPLPENIEFRGVTYTLAKVFKRDFYACTGLYQCGDIPQPAESVPEQIVYKHYHTDSLWFIPLGWLGRWLWRREDRFGRALADVQGVAHILDRHGESGMIREFIPGRNLREYLADHQVTAAFFVELKRILAEVHARGICHNDLNKPENILVREDGSPVLIDFQIALRCPSRLPIVRQLGQALVRYLQGMDRYHMLKHHVRHHPESLTVEDWQASQRRGLLLNLHAWLVRRPYRVVRHLVLRCFLMAKSTAP